MRAASSASSASAQASQKTSAAALINALCADPQALAQLAQALVGAGLAEAVHSSIDAAIGQHARQEAGRLLAGVVSTQSGWLIAASGGAPTKVMVFLGGSTQAVACVVPPHLVADVTAGAQVWVEPVNGSHADLLVVALRAFTATPAARIVFFPVTPIIWNSNALTTGSIQSVATAGNYGVPQNATGVLLFAYLWTGAPSTIGFGPGVSGSQYHWWLGTAQGQGWVPLDSAGVFHVNPGGGGNLTLYLAGYCR